MKTKKLCVLALITGAALVIFVAEAQIPALIAVPGVKLGLANVMVMCALLLYGRREALCVMIIKILLGSVFSGQMISLLYSAAGGALCFAALALLRGVFGEKQLWALSAFGAVAHNLGQLAAAIFVLGSAKLIYYLPVLLISGAVTGVFTGLCAQLALPRIKKAAQRL